MEIIFDTTTNLPITLEAFKTYVVETSSHRDAEMNTMLLMAIRKVEEHCNISLANHTITLITDKKVTHQKLYYRPVASIDSVTDADGLAVDYNTDANKRKIDISYPTELVIKYTTESRVEPQHTQAILDYATLLYNGSTNNQEYKNVLLKCYNPIL